jgi:CTD small phosphatase-like protein 2
VHCSLAKREGSLFSFPVHLDDGAEYQVWVKTRPWFQYFLDKVSKWFELILFTASKRCYAAKLVDLIDPNHLLK